MIAPDAVAAMEMQEELLPGSNELRVRQRVYVRFSLLNWEIFIHVMVA
jgi:hypothetical protein